MDKVRCFNCSSEVEINIANAIDFDGEVFKCPNCGKIFMYSRE